MSQASVLCLLCVCDSKASQITPEFKSSYVAN